MADNSTASELADFRISVQPDWMDLNGHMNVAYYVLAFDKATDAFYEYLHLSWAYRHAAENSLFTLGMNVDYVQEVFEGDPLRITTHLLDWNEKCLHYFHAMYHADTGFLAATNECLALHVSMETRRSAPFGEDSQQRIAALFADHQKRDLPKQASRVLAIRR